ncbi:MAG: hypothetical protein IRZ11_04730 [Clostridia bacterium]|nr:hypothetical protein [Clostridia bacterium]
MTFGPADADRPKAFADLAALLWLDVAASRNRLRLWLRDRRQLGALALLVAWVAFWGFAARNGGPGGRPPFPPGFADLARALVGPGFLVALGTVALVGARRAPALFAQPADGRFLLGTGLDRGALSFWLALRHAVAWLKGVAWGVLFALLFLATPDAGGARPIVGTGGLVLGLAASLSLFRVPAFALARRRPEAVALFAVLALAGGLAELTGMVAAAFAAPPGGRLPAFAQAAWPPAIALVRTAASDGASLALLASLLLLALALAAAAGRASLPEIWQSSTHGFAHRRRRRRTSPEAAGLPEAEARTRSSRASSAGRFAPGGAWVVLWRDAVGLLRGPVGAAGAALVVSGSIAGGVVLGLLAGPGGSLGRALAVVVVYAAFGVAVLTSVRIGPDLRRPLWWISTDPAPLRLVVRNLSVTCAWSVPTWAFLLAATSSARAPGEGFLLSLSASAAYWLVQAGALLVYAAVPLGAKELRGPAGFFRVLALLALALPPGLAAWLVVDLGAPTAAGFLAAWLLAAVEGWVVTARAARRVLEHALVYAASEAR